MYTILKYITYFFIIKEKSKTGSNFHSFPSSSEKIVELDRICPCGARRKLADPSRIVVPCYRWQLWNSKKTTALFSSPFWPFAWLAIGILWSIVQFMAKAREFCMFHRTSFQCFVIIELFSMKGLRLDNHIKSMLKEILHLKCLTLCWGQRKLCFCGANKWICNLLSLNSKHFGTEIRTLYGFWHLLFQTKPS